MFVKICNNLPRNVKVLVKSAVNHAKGKNRKGVKNMSGVTNFYLFIAQQGGFERFKRDADTNHNNVVQLNELFDYVQTNNIDASREDVYRIWNELDINLNGTNSLSNDGQVSERGSLNATEEARMEKQIVVYGKITTAIENVIRTISAELLDKYNITSDNLLGLAAETMISLYGLDAIADDSFDTVGAAKGAVAAAAQAMIKEGLLNHPNFKTALQNLGLGDYDLAHDETLLDLIDNMTLDHTTDNVNAFLWEFDSKVYYTIRWYMYGAGCANKPSQYEDDNSVAKWNDNNGLNPLQLAVITKKYQDAITVSKVNEACETLGLNLDFTDFSAELNTAIAQFIDEQINAQNVTFSTLNIQSNEILSNFMNSPAFKALQAVVEVSGEQQNILNKINNGEMGSWENWNALSNSQPVGLYRLLYFVTGMHNEQMQKLLGTAAFKTFLKEAYQEILTQNPVPTTQQEVNMALMRYFRANIETILEAAGFSDEEMMQALYQNVMGNCNQADPSHANWGTATLEDAKTAAKKYVYCVSVNYAEAIAEVDALSGSPIEKINNMTTVDEVKNAIEALRTAVQTLINNTPPTPPGPPTPQTVNFNLDESVLKEIFGDISDNPTGSTQIICSRVNGWSSAKSTAKTNFNAKVEILKQHGVTAGISPSALNSAAEVLKNYFAAVLNSFDCLFDDNTGVDNSLNGTLTQTNDENYTYTDASGQTHTINMSSNYRIDDDYKNVNSIVEISCSDCGGSNNNWSYLNNNLSPSGIYVGCDLEPGKKENYYVGVHFATIFNMYKDILQNFL